MAKLGFIEGVIARREGLADGYTVNFFHSLGGRDVRTDKDVRGVYDYVRKLGDDNNVKDLLGRVGKKVPGLIARVYGPDGKQCTATPRSATSASSALAYSTGSRTLQVPSGLRAIGSAVRVPHQERTIGVHHHGRLTSGSE